MSAYPSGSCASVALGSNVSPKLDRWKEIMDTPLAPQRFRDDDTSLTCSPTQGRTLSTLKRKIYCKNHYWPLPLVLMYCSFIFFRSVPRVESIAADWEPLNKVGQWTFQMMRAMFLGVIAIWSLERFFFGCCYVSMCIWNFLAKCKPHLEFTCG